MEKLRTSKEKFILLKAQMQHVALSLAACITLQFCHIIVLLAES